MAVLVEVSTIVNASKLISDARVEDDADSKHDNESDRPDGGDLLLLHGNGSKLSVLCSHYHFLPELESRRKSIVEIAVLAYIEMFVYLAETIQLVSLIINTFNMSSTSSTPYSNKEDVSCQWISNSSSRHELTEVLSHEHETSSFNVLVNCSCGNSIVSRDYGLVIAYHVQGGESLSMAANKLGMSERMLQDYNPSVDFSYWSGLIFFPGRDQNGTYSSSKSNSIGISLAACFYFIFHRGNKVTAKTFFQNHHSV